VGSDIDETYLAAAVERTRAAAVEKALPGRGTARMSKATLRNRLLRANSQI
jgi:hypothetical protein